jgi:hypothetical protein
MKGTAYIDPSKKGKVYFNIPTKWYVKQTDSTGNDSDWLSTDFFLNLKKEKSVVYSN